MVTKQDLIVKSVKFNQRLTRACIAHLIIILYQQANHWINMNKVSSYTIKTMPTSYSLESIMVVVSKKKLLFISPLGPLLKVGFTLVFSIDFESM